MSVFTIIATLSFLTLKKPLQVTSSTDLDASDSMDEYEEEVDELENRTLKEDMKSVVGMVFNQKMRLLLPLMLWTGVSMAVYTGLLVPMISSVITTDTKNIQYMKAMLAMSAFGVGETTGGLFVGQIIDRIGSRLSTIVIVVLVMITIAVTKAFLLVNQFNWLAFAMTFMWGFQDSAANTLANQMAGTEFDNNVEPFAVLSIL